MDKNIVLLSGILERYPDFERGDLGEIQADFRLGMKNSGDNFDWVRVRARKKWAILCREKMFKDMRVSIEGILKESGYVEAYDVSFPDEKKDQGPSVSQEEIGKSLGPVLEELEKGKTKKYPYALKHYRHGKRPPPPSFKLESPKEKKREFINHNFYEI